MARFFDLPVELRLKIYEYALPVGQHFMMYIINTQAMNTSAYPGMVFASKQLLHEAAPIFFKQNTFQFFTSVRHADLAQGMNLLKTSLRKDCLPWMESCDITVKVGCNYARIMHNNNLAKIHVTVNKDGQGGETLALNDGPSSLMRDDEIRHQITEYFQELNDWVWEAINIQDSAVTRKELGWGRLHPDWDGVKERDSFSLIWETDWE